MALPVPTEAGAEVLALRSRNVKTYSHVAGGERRIALVSSGVHFRRKDNGSWDDEDNLVTNAAGTLETWGQDISFRMSATGLQVTKGAYTATLKAASLQLWDRSAANRRTTLATSTFGTPTSPRLNVWRWANLFPGVDMEIQFTEFTAKERFVFNTRPSYTLPGNYNPATTWLVVTFDVVGNISTLYDETGVQVTNGYFDQKRLEIRDGGGVPLVYFQRPTAWDSSNPRAPTVFPVYFARTAQIAFGSCLAHADVQRAIYPLTLDPTTSVYTAASGDDGQITDNADNGTGDTVNTADIQMTVAHSDDGKGTVSTVRCYTRHDLSAISGTCNSSYLALYMSGQTGTGAWTVTPKLYTTDWSTLTTADYGQAGTDQTGIARASLTLSAYNNFTCTAANIEGKFGGVASFEIRGPASGDGQDAGFTTFDNTTNKPYLYVDYTAAGGTAVKDIIGAGLIAFAR